MSCAICSGPIRKGQYYVCVKAYAQVFDEHHNRTDEVMVMEDGLTKRYAHYGCVLKKCPELIGALNGGLRT